VAAREEHVDVEVRRIVGRAERRDRTGEPLLAGATPAPGSWPVIVFSHGFGGIRFQSYFLTERLATHGFIVIAPDHPGNTLVDFAQLGDDAAQAQSAIDRPLDILFSSTGSAR
jgi:predicted dienelactone hydrolase